MQERTTPLIGRLSGKDGGVQRRVAAEIDRSHLIGQRLAVRHELAKAVIDRAGGRGALRDREPPKGQILRWREAVTGKGHCVCSNAKSPPIGGLEKVWYCDAR